MDQGFKVDDYCIRQGVTSQPTTGQREVRLLHPPLAGISTLMQFAPAPAKTLIESKSAC
jgi:hypothetical protein